MWKTKIRSAVNRWSKRRKIFWGVVSLSVVSYAAVVITNTLLSKDVFLPSKAHVLGMPEISPTISANSYTGLHPSATTRPKDTFPYPIKLGQTGPVDTLFSGPKQYPFLCGVRDSGLGQPLVDNYQRWGVPVYKTNKSGLLDDIIIGYSKDCSIPTQAMYYYNKEGTEDFYLLSEADNDIAKINFNGKSIDFIVRVEFGTINRFIYTIAALKGENETLSTPNSSHWNKKLIYQFRGGVGIGYKQGRTSANVIFHRRYEQLAQGYAVAYSSGTQTSNHYNLWLSEDTALRVKNQFIGLYGKPEYTVGVGGSGGAIQQFVIAQNNPDIIDAAIAEYSYPDMVTQTTYAMDCELLEYYFDVQDRDNERWQHWPNRQLVEGLNVVDDKKSMFRWFQRLSQIKLGQWPSWSNGESECVNGWRGLTPLVNNPQFSHMIPKYDSAVADNVKWSHWNDLKFFYGTDEKGYGLSTWDNVGVQYGLRALKNGDITVDEFMKLNASIGGWKNPENMKQEDFWFLNGDIFPVKLSVWSHKNMRTGSLQNPAVRSEGNISAMNGAYKSGHVFLGHLSIPVIGLRHYLEPELDMHHLSASFSVRQRLLNGQGHTDNHLIWVTTKPHKGEVESFEVLDEWLSNNKRYPDRSLAENRPKMAVDKCFDKEGNVIAQGESVWNGQWNNQPAGACSKIYKPYTVSRVEAGASIAGDVFKCHLQPVKEAIAKGVYGDIDMSGSSNILESIFPDGVCDYSRGDVGRPKDLLAGSRLLPKQKSKNVAVIVDQKVPVKSVSLKPIEVSLYENEVVTPDTSKEEGAL